MFCQLMCPNLRCRRILRVPKESRGKLVRCQSCLALMRVPRAGEQPVAGATVEVVHTAALAARPSGSRHVA